jgi:phosphoglycerate dehydrogenase-like enzyme
MKNVGSLINEMDVLITYGEDLDEELINEASRLKWISVMSAGLEKLPFDPIREKDILVTNARGIHAIPMAEYVIGMMLSYIKQFPTMAVNKSNHIWNKKLPFGELNEKTLLVLGTGAIGNEIARLGKSFRMNTIGMNRSGNSPSSYFDDTIKVSQIEDTLPNADFIVSVLPSTSETKGLLKYKHFELMKNDAMFINIGRGDLMKEETIHEVLNDQVIGHMVLDVFPDEPLNKNSELWSYPNLTITPHTSSSSKKYLPRAFTIFEENFQRFINHKHDDYVNRIDIRKGY